MRQTKVRNEILNLLGKTKRPISAPELLNLVSVNYPTTNKTTIYRELQYLLGEQILKNVYLGDGVMRYEKTSSTCHHHLVCERCGNVQDVVFEESKLFKSMSISSGFEIKKHSIEFFGICSNCH